ncbi:MAG: putative toxin-antitoxin system toxin component, PIN family [Candidatus Geothermarchaeales archaeon]
MRSSRKRRVRVVLDGNVWVSAIVWGGIPARIVGAAEEGAIEILLSEEILVEINRILKYGRLRGIYEEAGVKREEIIAVLSRIGRFVDVTTKLDVVKEDPTDNAFIECAVDGRAGYLVSGDGHLLSIREYKNVKVVSAKDFIKVIEES